MPGIDPADGTPSVCGITDLHLCKALENTALPWDAPTVTVTTDEKKRVVIPSARPGDRFDVRVTAEGKIVLTRLELADRPDNVRLVRKHGYTVARGTRQITQEQVRRALDEFP